MEQTLKGRHKITAIIACLLIHGLMLVSIIMVELNDAEREPIIMIAEVQDEQTKQPLTEEQWVALNNSLPDSQFMHTPSATPQAAPPEEQPVDMAADQRQEAEKQPDQEITDQAIEQAIELATQFLETQLETEPELAQAPQEAPEKKQEKKPEQSPPPEAQKKLTLAQIAQGFVSQMQEAAMAVKSDQSGQASMKQLQQINYCQKIIGCIVNSYKINKYNAPKNSPDQRLCVQLSLKNDGTIHSLNIVQSSGNHQIDQFVLAMFKDASSSFPPLPKSLQRTPFHLPVFNIDRLESFQTTQGWYIDNRRS